MVVVAVELTVALVAAVADLLVVGHQLAVEDKADSEVVGLEVVQVEEYLDLGLGQLLEDWQPLLLMHSGFAVLIGLPRL